MKKNIFYMMVGVLCSLFVASCSTGDQMTDNDKAGTVTFRIADFPAFDGETSSSRADIGTYDAGKTAWTAGDKILVMVDFFQGDKKQYVTFTYTAAGTWTQTGDEVKTFSGNPNVYAYYAPSYQWSNGELALKSGKTAGIDEFITLRQGYHDLQNEIVIDFSRAERRYSRLRVAAESGSKSVTMSCANFIPAGRTIALGTSGTLTSTVDSKNNAYFYGTWPNGSSFTIHSDATSWYDITKTVTAASVDTQGYAISYAAPAPKIGDYYFNDGSWGTLASRPSPAVPIAVIFSTTTSEKDKNSGFKRGYALALRDATHTTNATNLVQWSQGTNNSDYRYNVDEPLLPDLKLQDWTYLRDYKDGYTDCKNIKDGNGYYKPFSYTNYPALWYAFNFGTDKVAGTSAFAAPARSSGWYIPTGGQWYDIIINLGQFSPSATGFQYSNGIIGWDANYSIAYPYHTYFTNKLNPYIRNAKDRNSSVDIFPEDNNWHTWWSIGDYHYKTSIDHGMYGTIFYYTDGAVSLYFADKTNAYNVRPVIAF